MDLPADFLEKVEAVQEDSGKLRPSRASPAASVPSTPSPFAPATVTVTAMSSRTAAAALPPRAAAALVYPPSPAVACVAGCQNWATADRSGTWRQRAGQCVMEEHGLAGGSSEPCNTTPTLRMPRETAPSYPYAGCTAHALWCPPTHPTPKGAI
eukprot:scaffold1042_cov146-Isochrysis_galbana.AAC.2